MKEVEHKVEYRDISTLKHWNINPRKISKDELERLKRSLKEDPDWLEARPIALSDRTGELVVIAGNQRVKAAKALGLKEVPCVIYHCKDETEEKRKAIKDNHENGEWDEEIFAEFFKDDPLEEWLGDEFDFKERREIVEDEPSPVDKETTFSVVGDIYQLGEHRIFCGSFDDDDKIRELFGNKKAICTFTDPPYNVAVKNRTTGKTIQNDDMPHDDFQDFLNRAFEVVASNTAVGGGGVISWMSDTEILTLKRAMDNAGLAFRTVLCWVKDHFTLGGNDFQSAKELAIYGVGEGKFARDDLSNETNDSQYACYARGKDGVFTDSRKLSNVWFFDKPKANKDHPTMKPVGLCAKGVLALSNTGDIVFDPFSGSGSTLIACEQTGRKCYGCEIDPKYCDVIRKRWWKFTHGTEDGWQEGTPAI